LGAGGYGSRVSVVVTRRSGTNIASSIPQYLVSFKGPRIYSAGGIQVIGADYSIDGDDYRYRLTNSSGGSTVLITGQYFGTVPSVTRVTYGYKPYDPTDEGDNTDNGGSPIYECTNVRAMTLSAGVSSLQCTMSSGIGQLLSFVVTVAEVPSLASADTVSYPAPQMLGNSMQFPGFAPSTTIVSNTTQGDIISFNGINVGNATDQVSVTYGVNPTYSCIMISVIESVRSNCGNLTVNGIISNNQVKSCSTISCRTLPGLGSWPMNVQVGLGTHSQSATTSDRYSYALSPEIWRVSGCTDIGNTTINCPTNGYLGSSNVVLAIYGNYFYGAITKVTIGAGLDCVIQPQSIQSSIVWCTLPVGVGLLQSVAVDRGLSFSLPQPLLSYSVPSLYNIQGCGTNDKSAILAVNCPRTGYVSITVNGVYFGVTGATVLIGGAECMNVAHVKGKEHTQITCDIPAGVGSSLAVLLFQKGGELSSNALALSYEPCAPGTYAEAYPSTVCTVCSIGQYQELPDAASCNDCPDGKYASASNATTCMDCSIGYYSTAASGSCSPCAINTYAASSGAVSCLPW
jgi:hypothetical protein